MESETKILVTVILPLMFLTAGIYGAGYYAREFTLTSEYEYKVRINPDGDIYNVNVTVPFPSNLSEGSFSHPEGWEPWINEEENKLSIAADNISAGSNSTLSLSMGADEEINAWNPLEKEPMLDPKANYTEFDPPDDSDADRFYRYNYTDVIEVIYEADNETEIEIYVELSGRSRWWLGDHIESQYYDRLSVNVEEEGEYPAEGYVETGIG